MLSYFARSTNAAFKSTFLASLLLVTSAAANAAPAGGEHDEWLLRVETEELKTQFMYKGAPVYPVAKVIVKYSRGDATDKPEMYEYLWYHDGKPIGMERRGNYGLKRGEMTSIQVVAKKENKPLGKEENKAAANTIMRLGLLAYHNFNPIEGIIVPENSFDEICDELRSHKCVDSQDEADKGNKGKIAFNMQSEPEGRYQRLSYIRNP